MPWSFLEPTIPPHFEVLVSEVLRGHDVWVQWVFSPSAVYHLHSSRMQILPSLVIWEAPG